MVAAAAIGRGETAPVSSSDDEATIKGIVRVEGKPATRGTMTFDPSNINRKMAAATSAPIGPDGSYTISTLVGRDIISLDLPGLATPKNEPNYSGLAYEVKAGGNTFDAVLPHP